ncbi:MAG TPA: serine/threonine-protein kinase, partial [Rhodothermales bacterium]
AERQILARLEHPNIARILDGGVADDGQPYLVMEYVEGVPITEYCTKNDLDVDARLTLFVDICDAVAYAHRNLIVHRDIKPSNVLVTDNGHVKLLDFGIAKLLGQDEADEEDDLPLTQTGVAVMTPEYAAPEQVSGGTITTATDVYALGIVLYELLAGERPYSFDQRSPSAIEQVVCNVEPQRPSTAARTRRSGESPDAARDRLSRRLRGDLDTIVLKALRKEPERRYASAAELAEDLRRHREGLPVTARPDTAGYRIRKFVGRNRLAVGAGVVVALALVGGLVASLIQVRIATIEREKADAVNAFLQDMLASPDPYADGPDIRVVDVLDRAEESLPERFARRPELEAALRKTLGTSFLELGMFERAESHLARAAELFAADGSGDDLVDTQASLGSLKRRTGDLESADSLMTLTMESDRRRHGPSSLRMAHRLADLGALRWEQGDFDGAEPLLLEALALFEKLDDADSLALAAVLAEVATLRADQGRSDEAEVLYRRSLALQRRVHGDETPEVPQLLTHIGIIRDDMEDYETARALHSEALELYRRLRGPQHPDVAYAMGNLASVEINLENFARAESLQLAAIAINTAALGENHTNVGIVYNNLASNYSKQGDAERALAAYRKSLEIFRAALPPDHPYIGYALANTGSVLFRMSRITEALRYLEEGYRIRVNLLPPESPQRAVSASWYGAALGRTGEIALAESLLVTSHQVLSDVMGPEHGWTVAARERLEAFRER